MDKTENRHSSFMNLFQHTEFTLGIIIVALFVITSAFTDNFLSLYNVSNLMKQCAIIGVLAVAQTFIITTGGIDISGGAITKTPIIAHCFIKFDTL